MNAAPILTFNADRHEYLLRGELVPSVTRILKPITEHEYRCVDRSVMETAAHLGRAVHSLINLDIRGELDEDALSEPLRPYLAAWRDFQAKSGFEALLTEQYVYSEKYKFAGTLDLFGTLNGKRALIDAKRTAAVPRSAGPQTAGYLIGLQESGGLRTDVNVDRFALHFTKDAKWKLIPLNDRNDQRVFLSALTLYNYLEKRL